MPRWTMPRSSRTWLNTHFPNARQIVLVQDNLSTHRPASLYQAFPAAEARRLVERFEWHYPAATTVVLTLKERQVLEALAGSRKAEAPMRDNQETSSHDEEGV